MNLADAFASIHRQSLAALALVTAVCVAVGAGIWWMVLDLDRSVAPRRDQAVTLNRTVRLIQVDALHLAMAEDDLGRTQARKDLTAGLAGIDPMSLGLADIKPAIMDLSTAVDRSSAAATAAAMATASMNLQASRISDHTTHLVRALADLRQAAQAHIRVEREQIQRGTHVAILLSDAGMTLERTRNVLTSPHPESASLAACLDALGPIAGDATVSNSNRIRDLVAGLRSVDLADRAATGTAATSIGALVTDIHGWVDALHTDITTHNGALDTAIQSTTRINALAIRAGSCDTAGRRINALAMAIRLCAQPEEAKPLAKEMESALENVHASLRTIEEGLPSLAALGRTDAVGPAITAIREDTRSIGALISGPNGFIAVQQEALAARASTTTALTRVDTVITAAVRDQDLSMESAGADQRLAQRRILGVTAGAPMVILAIAGAAGLISLKLVRRARREIVEREERKAEQDRRLAGMVTKITEDISVLAATAERMRIMASTLGHGVGTSARSITSAKDDLERVEAAVQGVATAAEELSSTIADLARNAQEAARVSHDAVGIATDSEHLMRMLQERTGSIAAIGSLIRNIAQRTNLLALNAQIEAAQAGAAGRGFTVVAMEVKSLAQETLRQVETVSQDITAVTEGIARLSDAIHRTRTIVTTINDVQNNMAAAVEEQTATVGEIARQMSDARQAAGSVVAAVGVIAHESLDMTAAATQSQAVAETIAGLATDLTATVRS